MRRLTRKASRYFLYRYIHAPHGISFEDQGNPHTHLWDRLDYEDITMSKRFITAYYHLYILSNPDWYSNFWNMVDGVGPDVQFHAHGTNRGKERDIQSITNRYFMDVELPNLLLRKWYLSRLITIDIALGLLIF